MAMESFSKLAVSAAVECVRQDDACLPLVALQSLQISQQCCFLPSNRLLGCRLSRTQLHRCWSDSWSISSDWSGSCLKWNGGGKS